MLARKQWRWKSIFFAAAIVAVFLVIFVNFIDSDQYRAIHKYVTSRQNHVQTLNLQIANDISIEVETEILPNDKLRSAVTVLGNEDMVQNVSDKIVDDLIEILSNPRNATPEINTDDGNETTRDESILLPATLKKLQRKLRCLHRSLERAVSQRGEYWVFSNYIPADHGPLACHQYVTFVTHSDFTFLENLVPVLERWRGPLSVAVHAPGDDLAPAVDTMRYMRDCSGGAALVRRWVTFHLFFHKDHMPKQVPHIEDFLSTRYNCSLPEPFLANTSTTYKMQKDLLYPVNVGRNVAREAALTHFVFVSDIELYPSPTLGARFLNMVARDPSALNTTKPKVFPIVLFEVASDQQVPTDKNSLLQMLRDKKAIPFHKNMCPACHNVPMFKEWLEQNDTGQMDVFTVGKRTGSFARWEPIFIGTRADPMYEERLSWEGKSDKMPQSYIMCVMDYDYMILNDAFLVHRPGIKTYRSDTKRDRLVAVTNSLIKNVISKELKVMFGEREGCVV